MSQLFATLWTVACQALLFMEFSQQESWSGLPCPPPGDLSDLGSNPGLLHCRQILYRLSHQESPFSICNLHQNINNAFASCERLWICSRILSDFLQCEHVSTKR